MSAGVRIALLAQEVSPTYAGGGIGTYTAYLAGGLRSLGHDVVVVGRHEGPWTERDGTVYAPRIHLPARDRYPTLADRVEAALEVRNAVKRLGTFDVIEGPDWLAEAALLPRGAARLHARHVHGGHRLLREHAGWLPDRQQRLAERFEARDLRRAGVVTAASRLSTLLPGGTSVLAREPRLVPMPLRWPEPSPMTGERVVALVGRIERRKGPEALIDAAAEVGDVTVRLIGRDTTTDTGESYATTLRHRADDRGVRLDVAGPRSADDMPEALAEARVVAVPSRYEPFSMVALEALGAGRPVVLSDACGAAEVLPDGVGAFVFPAGDTAALAAHLRRLLDDPSPGAHGPAYVRSHHSPEAAAVAKQQVWREALGTP
jgi:glycosyltransferase involved in cell wall biosynthesis